MAGKISRDEMDDSMDYEEEAGEGIVVSIISSPKLSIVDKRQVSDLLLCELLRYIGKRVRKTSNSSFFLTDGPVFVMYFEPRVGGFPLVHLHTCYLKYLSK